MEAPFSFAPSLAAPHHEDAAHQGEASADAPAVPPLFPSSQQFSPQQSQAPCRQQPPQQQKPWQQPQQRQQQPQQQPQQRRSVKRNPLAPKRPMSPYVTFVKENWSKKNVEMGSSAAAKDVMRALGETWNAMAASDKEVWKSKSDLDKARYAEEMRTFRGPITVPRDGRTKQQQHNHHHQKKDPNAPKRGPSAFLIFANEKRSGLRALHPEKHNVEISKMLGALWKASDDAAKSPYLRAEALARERYERDMSAYRQKNREYLERHPPLFNDGVAAHFSAFPAPAGVFFPPGGGGLGVGGLDTGNPPLLPSTGPRGGGTDSTGALSSSLQQQQRLSPGRDCAAVGSSSSSSSKGGFPFDENPASSLNYYYTPPDNFGYAFPHNPGNYPPAS